jgi:hypothetical protein
VAAAILLTGVTAIRTEAMDIRLADGEITGSFNTTLSVGTAVRVADRDSRLVAQTNGGTGYGINTDDGDLNYDRGDVVSASTKATHELLLSYRSFDLFARGFYFYDAEIMNGSTARTAINDAAKAEIGRDVTLLDAYLAVNTYLGDMPVTVRLGNQVLNWGESVFIQNGINSIAPVELSKLRVAGAELKEAIKAVPMLDIDLGLTDRLSVEGFYQFGWDDTEIEPAGTFFSTSDLAGPGGEYVFWGYGVDSLICDAPPSIGEKPPIGGIARRLPSREPRDGGQFGVAVRWFEPRLNDAELGFYFHRIHSRLPFVSGRTGTLQGLVDGDYSITGGMFLDFPEGIDTYGVSVSTDIIRTGTAVQGEFSYRPNQPLQWDSVELAYAILSPLDPYLDPENPDLEAFGLGYLGPWDFEETITAYRRSKVMQAQIGATQAFGRRLAADQVILVGEVGSTIVTDVSDAELERIDSPGTHLPVDPFFVAAGVAPAAQTDGFPDRVSWGYRLLVLGEYNNVIGAVKLRPRIAFAHDVGGTGPAPITSFVEGRKTITVGLGASFLMSWSGDISYTNSFGGGEFNLLNDRDFVAVSASYSF